MLCRIYVKYAKESGDVHLKYGIIKCRKKTKTAYSIHAWCNKIVNVLHLPRKFYTNLQSVKDMGLMYKHEKTGFFLKMLRRK